MLRLEGLAVLIFSIAAYWHLDGNRWWFFGLLLWPDLAFFAYLKGHLIGAKFYNALHTYIGPLLIGSGGMLPNQQTLVLFALIWTSHIGTDRIVGMALSIPNGLMSSTSDRKEKLQTEFSSCRHCWIIANEHC